MLLILIFNLYGTTVYLNVNNYPRKRFLTKMEVIWKTTGTVKITLKKQTVQITLQNNMQKIINNSAGADSTFSNCGKSTVFCYKNDEKEIGYHYAWCFTKKFWTLDSFSNGWLELHCRFIYNWIYFTYSLLSLKSLKFIQG